VLRTHNAANFSHKLSRHNRWESFALAAKFPANLKEHGKMTAQIPDRVVHQQKDYAIAGVNGGKLFDPNHYGIHPTGGHTGCWRSFYSTYEIDDNGIFLIEAVLFLSMEDQARVAAGVGPELFGKNAHKLLYKSYRRKFLSRKLVPHTTDMGEYVYEDLMEPIPFTGGMLIARDFIQEMYVHMGFHPAYKFRTVYEFLFEEGRVIEKHDRSENVAELRERLARLPPRELNEEERNEWVSRCFSLEYAPFG
jgi:hypothetical protein